MTLIIPFSPGRIHERVQVAPVMYVNVFPIYLHYRLFKDLRINSKDIFSTIFVQKLTGGFDDV
jgi:hypothetical protein